MFVFILKPPRHLKWAESSINVRIPGWERFKAADEWLAHHVGGSAPSGDTSELFSRFLNQNHIGNISPEDNATHFRRFLEWKQTQPSAR